MTDKNKKSSTLIQYFILFANSLMSESRRCVFYLIFMHWCSKSEVVTSESIWHLLSASIWHFSTLRSKEMMKKNSHRRFDTIKHCKLYIIDFKCGMHFDVMCITYWVIFEQSWFASAMEFVRFVEMVSKTWYSAPHSTHTAMQSVNLRPTGDFNCTMSHLYTSQYTFIVLW